MDKQTKNGKLQPLLLLKSGWGVFRSNYRVFIPSIFLAFAFVYGIHVQLIEFLRQRAPETEELELIIQSSALIGLLFSPIEVALMMLGVKAARNQRVTLANIFDHLAKTPVIIMITIISTAAIQLGMILVIPGIFLLVALSMAQLLVCDKNYSMVQAIKLSVQIITKHWFECFTVYLLLITLIILSFIAMGVPLLVSIPLYLCVKGKMYLRLFDDAGQSAEPNSNQNEFEA